MCAFEDPDIIHVDDSVDPVRDLEVIGNELRLKDIEFMDRRVEDLEKSMKRSNDKHLKIEHELCEREHGAEPIIPFSCVLERNLADMAPDEATKYCEENKVQSALPKIIKTGFSAINLIYFFTAGPDEVKCWQIRRQTKAPQAAGTIHSDFERGFICAEVMKFDDLKELGSESAVKAAGKYRQEGKTYVVQDGDVIFFKFNVSGGGKK
ncbi:hypothetical protein GH714_033613 [Hevea brasiliensis]|uniref:Obg-like ATPase homolog n=1 Tax=Hevea brasiliensis TaxID=3981 RepID=A0A6A6MQU6_HEVBR|nr:hypothetical protein GH714_033613 [Hevea brasiliensis]